MTITTHPVTKENPMDIQTRIENSRDNQTAYNAARLAYEAARADFDGACTTARRNFDEACAAYAIACVAWPDEALDAWSVAYEAALDRVPSR